ncbi:hypothetical protein D3C73_1284340 [compost metagenome]
MSNPVMATTPPNAMPRPTRTGHRCRVPRINWKTAIQPDCRHTKAVAAATDVSCKAVMKHAKWKASATAATADQPNSRRVILPNAFGSRMTTGPAITTAPIALRQNAIASAVTEVAPSVPAMRGPEEATPSTPSAAMRRFTDPP